MRFHGPSAISCQFMVEDEWLSLDRNDICAGQPSLQFPIMAKLGSSPLRCTPGALGLILM